MAVQPGFGLAWSRSIARVMTSVQGDRAARQSQRQPTVMICAATEKGLDCCGLRRGEVFGLSPEDIDHERGMLHARRQVQPIHGRLFFALPKGRKIRTVDLPPRWPRSSSVTSTSSHALRQRRRGDHLEHLHLEARVGQGWSFPPRAEGRRPGSGRWPRRTASTCFGAPTPRSCWKPEKPVVTSARWLGDSSPAITRGYYAHFMPEAGSKGRGTIDGLLGKGGASARRPKLPGFSPAPSTGDSRLCARQ